MSSVARASLCGMAVTALSCGQPSESPSFVKHPAIHPVALQGEAGLPQVLVLSPSGLAEQASGAALAAAIGELEAHFVTPEQWSTLTVSRFREYQALVIEAGGCGDSAMRALQAASDNREVWGRLIDGNVFLHAAAHDQENSLRLFTQGVSFASCEQGKTGLFLSLGCVYEEAAPGTSVPLLEPWGTFTLEGAGCTAEAPCEARAVFTRYPDRDFSPEASAWDSVGRAMPYALSRQATQSSAPISGSPPLARCQTVTVAATDTCSLDISIDAGSWDPDGDLVGCTQSPVGPYGSGTTAVTLTCGDAMGNSNSCAAAVSVIDANEPLLSLIGPSFLSWECGNGPFEDPGASATDLCAGDITGSIVRAGQVYDFAPGVYSLQYSVTDPSGNAAMPTMRGVIVTDTLRPVITLRGPSSLAYECGSGPYRDPGAVAMDLCAASGEALVTGSVNDRMPGSYILSYNAIDASGNAAVQKTRSVTVLDTLPPQVTLQGPASQELECGTAYTDPGATATDLCARDVSASLVRSGWVNTGTVGSYTLGYSATDRAGNTSVQTLRAVHVVDTQAPSLKLLGPASQTVPVGMPYSDPGVTAADQCSGLVRVMISGTVNTSVPGTYSLSYRARDRFSNTSQPLTRTVTVVGAPESIATWPAGE